MSIDEFTLSTVIDIEKNIQTKYNLNGSVFYDDQYIFACSLNFDTILIDINTEKVVKTFTGSRRFSTISPDGKLMCSGSSDKTVKIWNITTGECIKTLEEHEIVYVVSFSPKGDLICSGSSDKTVKIWNITTGECIKTLKGHENTVRSVSFSPEGDLICSGSLDKTVKIWNITTGECIKTLKGHENAVRSVSFSPEGDLICSGSSDNTVKIWNITTGECIKTLKRHESVSSELDKLIAKFSPVDNNIICSASTVDQKMKIWNKEEEKENKINLYDDPLSIDFSKNGKRICCSLHNNKIMIIETLEELRKELRKELKIKELKIIIEEKQKKHFYVHGITRIINEILEEEEKAVKDGRKRRSKSRKRSKRRKRSKSRKRSKRRKRRTRIL